MRPALLKALLAAAAVLGPAVLVRVVRQLVPRISTVYFSTFLEDLRNRRVERVLMGQDALDVVLTADAAQAAGMRGYRTSLVPTEGGDVPLVSLMEAAGARFAKAPRPVAGRVMAVLVALIPIVYLAASYKLLTKALNPDDAKATAKKSTNAVRVNVSFQDVAGADAARTELEEIVDFLANPAKYRAMGARIPKGVLLSGPSGTGKTLLAKALASEAGVPFMFCSASDFVEMLVGRGAARVRDLFEQASACAPCIVFIDELDALAKARGGLNSNDEREQTLNQLLTEMDGFQHAAVGADKRPVIVVAATNRPEVLDPALVRPGRFDRHVHVGLPDEDGRLAILRIHTRSMRLAPDVDLEELAQATQGFAGAHLANVANEAAMLAVRAGARDVSQRQLRDAAARVQAMQDATGGGAEGDLLARLLHRR